jgi:DHA2 family multidrug resistance protein
MADTAKTASGDENWDSSNSAAAPGINPWIVALVVSMATFMEVLDSSIANVALPHISGSLGSSQSDSTWVLTSYLVSNAIVMPISGWLSSVIGRKRFYMTCVAIFTISSLLCGLAPSLPLLLLFRVLQGIGGGGLAPTEQAILADTFPPSKRGMAFAVYGVAVVVAPALGPTLGGYITDNFSWRWIFWINIPIGVLSLLLTSFTVQDSAKAIKKRKAERKRGIRVDYTGFIFTAMAFGALQVVLDKGQEDDWLASGFICVMAGIAVIGALGLCLWETMVVADPIVDVPLMKDPSFSIPMALQFMMGVVLNATTTLLPQIVQNLMGYNATRAGMILMPGGLMLIVLFPLVGALTKFIQPKYLMAFGMLLTAISMYHLTGINAQASYSWLVWARALQIIGLPFFFLPITAIAYSNLPPGKSDNASALMNLSRNLGGSIGISIATVIVTRRTQFHLDRLSGNVSHGFRPFVNYMNSTGGFTRSNIVSFYNTLESQASMMGYIDIFKILGVGCAIVVACCLVLRTVKPGTKAVMAH